MSSPRKKIIAICYDFDGTLTRGNIQENSFLPKLGIKAKDFWKEVDDYCKRHEMDQILAYMHLMLKYANEKKIKVERASFKKHGRGINLYPSVENYFENVKKYAKSKNLPLEHYIISSGIKEMIEGTKIKKYFTQIYASSFMYDFIHDDDNEPVESAAIGPAMAINYTTKTQYLFRINKGIMDCWDNSTINQYIPNSKKRIAFENMIYIGDGDTDIPAMKMVNHQGGTSIVVYPPNTRGAKDKAKDLVRQKRATYFAKADYGENSELYKIITKIIDRLAITQELKKFTANFDEVKR